MSFVFSTELSVKASLPQFFQDWPQETPKIRFLQGRRYREFSAVVLRLRPARTQLPPIFWLGVVGTPCREAATANFPGSYPRRLAEIRPLQGRRYREFSASAWQWKRPVFMDFGVFSLRGVPPRRSGPPRAPPWAAGSHFRWILGAPGRHFGVPWGTLGPPLAPFSALGALKRRPRSARRPRREKAAPSGRQGRLRTGVLVPKPQQA